MTNKESQQRFNTFIQELESKTGYSKKEIIAILKRNKIEGFKPDNYGELRSIVMGTYAMKEQLSRQISDHEAKYPEIKHDCPICDGKQVKDGHHGYPWICSKGGTRCHVVFRSATAMERLRERNNGTDPATFEERRSASIKLLLESYDVPQEEEAENKSESSTPCSTASEETLQPRLVQ